MLYLFITQRSRFGIQNTKGAHLAAVQVPHGATCIKTNMRFTRYIGHMRKAIILSRIIDDKNIVFTQDGLSADRHFPRYCPFPILYPGLGPHPLFIHQCYQRRWHIKKTFRQTG